MGVKRCENCEEMVEEAKAFCPGCGNSFVAEEAREASSFEKMDSTVQLGNTMYNQMLSDMGLNIAKAAPVREKHIEIIEPIAAAPEPQRAPAQPPRSNNTKWVILGVAIILLGLLLILAAAILLYLFWPRIS